MLRLRLLSAFIAIPIVLAVVITGGPVALVLALIIGALGAYELWHMFAHAGYRPWSVVIIALSLFFIADAYFDVYPSLPFGITYRDNIRQPVLVIALLATFIRETILAGYGENLRQIFRPPARPRSPITHFVESLRRSTNHTAVAVAGGSEFPPAETTVEPPLASNAALSSTGNSTTLDESSTAGGGLTNALVNISLTFIGPFYVGLLLSYALRLRYLPDDGLLWTVLLLLGTWGTDTGAYFAGRYFGKHHFFPRISPKKTWEGVAGGVILSIVAALLVIPFLGLPLWHALPLGILMAAAAVMGDLVESLIKRASSVKDSGTLFPGHGGVLDRIDSLIFVATALYFYATWFAGG